MPTPNNLIKSIKENIVANIIADISTEFTKGENSKEGIEFQKLVQKKIQDDLKTRVIFEMFTSRLKHPSKENIDNYLEGTLPDNELKNTVITEISKFIKSKIISQEINYEYFERVKETDPL